MKRSRVFRLIHLWLLFLTMTLLSACGMPMRYSRNITMYEPMKEVSVVKELELNVPQGKKKQSDSFMVAFVKPAYDVTSTSPSGYMAAVGYKKADVAKNQYLETLRKSLQTDLDYILLQKGIRVLGTFTSSDEMTFDQKKRAIYTFTPMITVSVDEQKMGGTGSGYKENGTFIIRGYITLLLRESITQEKLWVKRIEAQPATKQYDFAAKFREPNKVTSDVEMMFTAGVEEKDNSDKALADALAEFYTNLGKKLWEHIDAEEWEKYLSQAVVVRKEKRY